MKISREQKQEHHERFIQALVDEVRAQGYAAVTLRDVARRAGLSDGAIYKYFSSKEKILLAYYILKMERLRVEGAALLAKSSYTLAEKVQALLEFQINQYEGEKDFLEKTFHPTFVAASLMWSEVAAMRKVYLETVGAFVKDAEAKGELPEVAWAGVVDEMLWCHYMGVMLYWLKDDSAHHEDTTQFIDRTVNLFTAVVGGPLLKQAEELVGFLVNRHLMPLLMNLGSMGKSKAGFGSQGSGPMGFGSDPAGKESKSRPGRGSSSSPGTESKTRTGAETKSPAATASKSGDKSGSKSGSNSGSKRDLRGRA